MMYWLRWHRVSGRGRAHLIRSADVAGWAWSWCGKVRRPEAAWRWVEEADDQCGLCARRQETT